ncbi:hypothetical protein O7602_23895 [Micromonospora sp. WMMD1128]|uniref:hypothetical protein n=1 Tax=Micromonospora sp. WMMD1128 TaxID=3015150 RepID=UPI00248C30CA|nr:hypothetical protein [Micromonospora sp. WMMD1128]WBB72716.1 hypothetical protein O7602_23895 [Micromonospora sp. WMMD1128]
MPSSRSRKLRTLAAAASALGLAIVAIVWGLRGVEVTSWLAGVGSFVAAVASLSAGTGGQLPRRLGHRFTASLGGRIRRVALSGEGDSTFHATSGGVIEDIRATGTPVTSTALPEPAPARDDAVATEPVIRVVDGLIDRGDQLRAVLGGIRESGRGTFAVVGGHGMGKSSFLSLLRDAVRREFPDAVLMPMRPQESPELYGLSDAYSGQYGSAVTPAVAALLLDKSAQFLGDLVQDVVGQFGTFVVAKEGVPRASNVTMNNTFVAKSWGAISNAQVDVNVKGPAESAIERLSRAQRRVDDAFLADWRAFLAGRRAILILDGFETLIDDAVGQWFVRLARRLPDTAVVLSLVPREYAEHGRRVLDPDLIEELPRFTVAEAHSYLTYHFGDRAGIRLAQAVTKFTGGHPYGLRLVRQFITAHLDEALVPGRLREMLIDLSDGGDPQLDRLVREVIQPDRNPSVWRVAEVASLLNSFDVPMLVDLLGSEDPPAGPEQVSNAVRQIERLGLLDPLSVAGRFRLHDFIRPAMSEAVRRFTPDRWTRIHSRAAGYYYRQITEIESKTETAYGSWFKYEDAVWQMHETEWMYHSAQLSGDRDLTRAQFVVLFLEAFWWWGLYVDFAFCHQLLESWQRAAQNDMDRDLLDEIRRFHANYPTGPDKPAGEHWTEARHALRTVGELCGVRHGWQAPGRSPEAEGVYRRAWLYLRLFIAHTFWYDNRFADAERAYRQLESEFADLDDDWMVAWLYFEWAEVAYAAGDRGSAAARCRLSSGMIRRVAEAGEVDSELLAYVHRLLADLLHDADPVAAAREYGQAVKRAFVFHRMANSLDPVVSAPDEYTSQFYEEMTTRAAGRVPGWAGHGSFPDILAALVEPTAGDAPDVARLDADGPALAAALFPRGPRPNELYQRRGPFTDYWGDVVERLDLDAGVELDTIDRLTEALRG